MIRAPLIFRAYVIHLSNNTHLSQSIFFTTCFTLMSDISKAWPSCCSGVDNSDIVKQLEVFCMTLYNGFKWHEIWNMNSCRLPSTLIQIEIDQLAIQNKSMISVMRKCIYWNIQLNHKNLRNIRIYWITKCKGINEYIKLILYK